jgi:hypothetical protein
MYIAGITHTAKTEMRQIVVWGCRGGQGGGGITIVEKKN